MTPYPAWEPPPDSMNTHPNHSNTMEFHAPSCRCSVPPGQARETGFSLIELLVVIAIIAVLSGLAVTGFNSIGRSSGANGAATVASSLALSTRIESMSHGLGARLVVDNGSDANTKLRRFVVFRDKGEPGNPVWEMAGRPTTLPGGIYFLPRYSSGYVATNMPLPGNPSAPVLAYEFNGRGHLEPPSTATDSRMVFCGGPLDPSGNPPDGALPARSGVLLRNNGRSVFFQSPDQMPIVN